MHADNSVHNQCWIASPTACSCKYPRLLLPHPNIIQHPSLLAAAYHHYWLVALIVQHKFSACGGYRCVGSWPSQEIHRRPLDQCVIASRSRTSPPIPQEIFTQKFPAVSCRLGRFRQMLHRCDPAATSAGRLIESKKCCML